MPSEFIKDPGAVLDYEWDWSAWLAEGESIATATVTVPAGLTLDNHSSTATTVTAWISGGTAGIAYDVSCHIVTDNSPARVDERSIKIWVQER